jgi:hypothetical protein
MTSSHHPKSLIAKSTANAGTAFANITRPNGSKPSSSSAMTFPIASTTRARRRSSGCRDSRVCLNSPALCSTIGRAVEDSRGDSGCGGAGARQDITARNIEWGEPAYNVNLVLRAFPGPCTPWCRAKLVPRGSSKQTSLKRIPRVDRTPQRAGHGTATLWLGFFDHHGAGVT